MDSLKQMAQSLLAAKHNVTKLEGRFLRHLSRVADNGRVQREPIQRPMRRRIKCPKCPRQFALPLHLGRHLSVTHRTKSRPASKRSR